MRLSWHTSLLSVLFLKRTAVLISLVYIVLALFFGYNNNVPSFMVTYFVKGVLVLYSSSFVYFLEVEEETTTRWEKSVLIAPLISMKGTFDFKYFLGFGHFGFSILRHLEKEEAGQSSEDDSEKKLG